MAKRKTTHKRSPLGLRLESRLRGLRDTLKSGEPLEKKYTARIVVLDLEPKDFRREEIRGIRENLQVSQAIFARMVGTSVKTIASWEQGTRQPTLMARRLLEEVDRDADRWREILRNSLAKTDAFEEEGGAQSGHELAEH